MAIKGYWRLNGNSNDASGNSNNGTDTSITYSQANGVLNGGAGFNGSSSRISVTNNLTLNGNAGTWSFLAKNTSSHITPDTNNYIFLQKADVTGSYSGISIFEYQSLIAVQIKRVDNSGQLNMSYLSNITTKWNLITLTFSSGSTCILYYNGIKVTNAVAPSFSFSTQNLIMGSSVNSFWQNYAGNMDEIIIDNTIWASAKVKNEYSRIKGFF